MSVSFTPSQVALILYIEHSEYGGPATDPKSVLASRAYDVFKREFEHYQHGRRSLSEVRKYHRHLTAALREVDLFLKKERIEDDVRNHEMALAAGFTSYNEYLMDAKHIRHYQRIKTQQERQYSWSWEPLK